MRTIETFNLKLPDHQSRARSTLGAYESDRKGD